MKDVDFIKCWFIASVLFVAGFAARMSYADVPKHPQLVAAIVILENNLPFKVIGFTADGEAFPVDARGWSKAQVDKVMALVPNPFHHYGIETGGKCNRPVLHGLTETGL